MVKHQKGSKDYETDCLQNFLLLFMFLSTAKFFQKRSYLGYNILYLYKKGPKTDLEFFLYQISTSVKQPEKQLPSKAKFRTLLPLVCPSFRSEQCEGP